MTHKQLIQRVETNLLRRRDALRRTLSGELGQFRTSDDSVVGDPIDVALDTEYAEINCELAETETRELAQIERALERVREGSYGVCEHCGRKIPVARLQAVPHASMCIQCRRLVEEGHATEPGLNSWSQTGDVSDDRDGPTLYRFDLVK
jgi:DnaK suppressor protein